MSKTAQIATSFNGGELSPLMMGRTDVPKFKSGCEVLENMICLVQGPAVRRGGFRYMAEVKDSSKATRLIPFEVGSEAAYDIEVGNQYFRFYHNGARVESGGVPVEIVTPYLTADLFAIHFAQSADVMYLFHQNYPVQKLSRLTADGLTWSLKEVSFNPPPTYEADSDYSGGTIKIALSAVTGTGVKVVSSAAAFLAADAGRLLKYLDGLASITAYVGAQEVTAEIVDGFLSTLVDTTPTATLTTDAGADKKIINFSEAHGITAVQATAGIWLRLMTGPQAGEMRQVASVTDADTLVLTAAWSVDQTAQSFSKHYAIAAGSWLMGGSPVASCTPSIIEPIGAIATLPLAADGWRAADVGKFVKINAGIVKITAYASPTSVSGQIIKPIYSTAAIAGGAWTAEMPSWSATAGYPSTGCFFEQRLMLAGSKAQPTTVWGSKNGDYENFSDGINDADAPVYPLASVKVNAARWLMPTRVLLGGTVGGEFSITGGSGTTITPLNIKALSETTHGSSTIRPIRVGGLVLFVQAQGRKLREIQYDAQITGSFVAPDLTRLAEHVTKDAEIVDLAYQQETESLVWCALADGKLGGMTYNREDEVFGWHRHTTAGLFESVSVTPDAVNHRDRLTAVVKRTIDGVPKRYVEYLDPDWPNADSFVLYDGVATTAINGLGHLEGEAVDVVADGFYVPGLTVTGGKVTLPKAATVVVVGLHYESTITPTRPEFVNDAGFTTIGRNKQWQKIIIRVLETGVSGLTINGRKPAPRTSSDYPDHAVALYTGDVESPMLGAARDGLLTIKQTLPLPFTLLAITGTLDVGD